MLGHQVLTELRKHVDVEAMSRTTTPAVDATNIASVERAIDLVRPSVVINCIGIVRQRSVAQAEAITVNALFPHLLADIVKSRNVHLVHISTDCVYSGRCGMYCEDDPVDPVDAYGMTKALGEPFGPHVTTIRTTFVGRELRRQSGLLEWFLRQRSCRGYRRHFFSVMTTLRVARVLASIVRDGAPRSGLFHLAGPRVSKHDFLMAVRDALQLDIEIAPDDATECDRSLIGERFRRTFGIPTAPTLTDIIEDLSDGI
jgi:dTDP-4-dehydrorhamnose reductase